MPGPTRTIIATTALWIVCKAANRDQMNATLATVDSGGNTEVLTAPLTVAGDDAQVVVAYWCGWDMDDAQRSTLIAALGQQGWRPLRGSEGAVLGPTDPVPAFSTNQRFWTWEGRSVTSTHVLASLGLAPIRGE